jgi:adenosylmethionine---8-amino-7-oxononanoate aminotransferase
MYSAALLDQLLVAIKANGIICIADEVMTGFGRTGKLFASEHLNEKPDIICLSKGLTGGVMALGVTACTDQIYQAYCDDDKMKTFFHGHSFTANPLACTAALASLHLLDKDCMDSVEQICSWNRDFLAKITHYADGTGAVLRNCRQLGTILAFEINKGEDIYLNQIGQQVTRLAMEQEIYLRPLGNTVYFMPPYCLTREEYSRLEAATESIIKAV